MASAGFSSIVRVLDDGHGQFETSCNAACGNWSSSEDALAAVSHDLRTPLTRIRLRAEFVDDASLQRKLNADIDAMQGMVNSVLAYLRGLRRWRSAERRNAADAARRGHVGGVRRKLDQPAGGRGASSPDLPRRHG